MKHVILLDGAIGVGKTTLGRGLADEIGAGFIDGDDHADPNKAWYETALTTSRSIVSEARRVLDDRPVVVIAYPINCLAWIYFRRTFAKYAARTILIGLTADYDAILAEDRGRQFDAAEKLRVKEMIRQGYGRREFGELVLATDRQGFSDTLYELINETRRLVRPPP